MTVIFEQVFTLMLFGIVGFALAKGKLIKAEHTQILTTLLVYVFSACNTFKSFATSFTVEYFKNNYMVLAAGMVTLAVLLIAAHFGAKLFSKDKYPRYVYEYSLVVPNYGYFGYALAESLMGATGLISAMVFSIPMSIYIYLIAFCLLSKKPLSPKGILNPFTVAMVLGMIAGLLEIPIPRLANTILDTSRACMAPVSMILAGVVISRFNIKKILSNKRIYVVTFFRLIATPIALGAFLGLFFPSYAVQAAVMMMALPCGLNTVVFPDLVDEDCSIGAGLALVSSLLSCITIPIVFTLFGIGV